MRSREIRLARRPDGAPNADTFSLGATEVRAPSDGEVLVRNDYMSVDPYMRGRMNDAPSYAPPFALGEPLAGRAIGTVVESRASLAPGTVVTSDFGWREYFTAPHDRVHALDLDGLPATAYLGALGMTGFTAWVGLERIAGLQAGETVYVSTAAGAVGSMAVQIAKGKGCRVVGSTGNAEKVRFVKESLGADGAFDYHAGPIRDRLRELAPDGIDVYFDNTGGEALEAALVALRNYGRVALCGAITAYNTSGPVPGTRYLALAIGKRLRLQGFIVGDHAADYATFLDLVRPLAKSGKLVMAETIVEGIERAPEAFLHLLGPNTATGKVIVRL